MLARLAEYQQKQMMAIKGKRTKRPRPASPTSSSSLDNTGARLATASSSTATAIDLCNSPSTTQEEEDMAYCLILLAQGNTRLENYPSQHQNSDALIYECKTCSRSFPSFQALGGHRASHKKLKTEPEPLQLAGVGLSLQTPCNKLKVHACGFCGAEFSSGQALGGHMRRHRSLIAGGGSTPATQSASSHEPPRSLQLCLDLNLPAAEEQQDPETPKFLFGSNNNMLVFTAGSLVDCRY